MQQLVIRASRPRGAHLSSVGHAHRYHGYATRAVVQYVRTPVKPYLLVLVAACGSRGATQDPPAPTTPPATPTEHEKLGIVFERLLVAWESPEPLFGPDGSVTVGERRWTADGADAGRHVFASSGQLRPVAIAGTPDEPRVIALGWSGLDDVPPAPPAEDRAWLVTGDVRSETAGTLTPIHHEYLGENNIELSPDGALLVTIERTDVVVRFAATGIERARHPLGAVDDSISFPDAQHVCWLDNEHVGWIGHDKTTPVLRVAAMHGAIATTPLANPPRSSRAIPRVTRQPSSSRARSP